MKKNTFIFFSLFTTITATGQEIISSQGETYSNANGSIDFTIGEVIINTGTDGSNDLTQGFHQTTWNFLGVVDNAPNYQANIFPNPTQDVLNIQTSEFENVTYTMFDAQGKLVMQDKLSDELSQIHVSQLTMGNYSIVLKSDTQILKTFKLIKTN